MIPLIAFDNICSNVAHVREAVMIWALDLDNLANTVNGFCREYRDEPSSNKCAYGGTLLFQCFLIALMGKGGKPIFPDDVDIR